MARWVSQEKPHVANAEFREQNSHQKVGEEYVHALDCMYSRQMAFVKSYKDSDPFRINRGTKQGDPISLAFSIQRSDTTGNGTNVGEMESEERWSGFVWLFR